MLRAFTYSPAGGFLSTNNTKMTSIILDKWCPSAYRAHGSSYLSCSITTYHARGGKCHLHGDSKSIISQFALCLPRLLPLEFDRVERRFLFGMIVHFPPVISLCRRKPRYRLFRFRIWSQPCRNTWPKSR